MRTFMKIVEIVFWTIFWVLFALAAYGHLKSEYMIRKKQKEDMSKDLEEIRKKQKTTSKEEMQKFLDELEEMKKGKIPIPPKDCR